MTPEQLSEIFQSVLVSELNKIGPRLYVKKEEKKLYSREETCKIFSISKPCLNDWTKKGLIKSIRVGGRVYYSASQIDLIINKKG